MFYLTCHLKIATLLAKFSKCIWLNSGALMGLHLKTSFPEDFYNANFSTAKVQHAN